MRRAALIILAVSTLATTALSASDATPEATPITATTASGSPAAVITEEAIETAAAETLSDDPPADEAPKAEDEEARGRIEAMGEAFTEMKNIVDNLNRMKLGFYLQAQYVDDESSRQRLTSPTATQNKDQFSIRRGRMKFTYTANPTAKLVISIDASSSGVVLKDGYLELTEPWTSWKNTLTAGQFNWPFGFEIGYSSSDREMPERSRVIRTLFPGERDRGVMVSGRTSSERFNYSLAVVNGTGTSQSFDFNAHKDIVGRLGGSFGALDLGVSGYQGEDLIATTAVPAGVELDKTRYGVDFQLVTPLPGLAARGEFIQGEERGADVQGWYAYLIQNIGTRHQFVVRADDYDPNTDVDTNAIMTIGGSYIFHWDENTKVMLAYEHPETEGTDPDDNVATVRLQYKF